jgi:hypothetical protein
MAFTHFQGITMPKFEKGHPGGPGRPRGSRNVVNLLLDEMAEAEAQTMVRKMIDAASDGDRVATRLVLSRIWSAPKGRAIQLDLPDIRTPADLLVAHAAVATAVSNGSLTPQDGASMSTMLETHRRAFELVAQEQKIEQLDDRLRQYKDELK